MSREDRNDLRPEACPECGSELAVERGEFNGTAVTIVACTGYPDCDYFYWFPVGRSDFDVLSDWAIKRSLKVLRRSPSDPPREYASLRNLFGGFGGGGRG